jgi:peptidoglycan/LPS O-acetylase OafA/YrhL
MVAELEMSTLTLPAPVAAPSAAAKRIPTLDGWRGIAILLVLVGHFAPSIGGSSIPWLNRIGLHGVAIFFVLSGFLITTLLMREREQTGTVNLRRFYLRRFFRLMPCAWCFLAMMAFLNAWTPTKLFSPGEIYGAIFFFRNYVGSELHPITGHFWSLSIEEQFYLFWPSLLLMLGATRARWFAVAAAAAIAAYRFLHWGEISSQPFAVSEMTQYRADALLVGCIMALVLPELRRYLRAWMALPLLAGVLACMRLHSDMIPLHESVLVALLLAVTSQCSAPFLRVLDFKPLAFLGTISYSIYVWQQPFWMFARPTVTGVCVALSMLAAVAVASYYLIEKPAIAFGRKLVEAPRTPHQTPLTITVP